MGAVVNPNATPQDFQLLMFEKKVCAGAEFFQTQTIFDAQEFKKFHDATSKQGVKVLAGITLIKSVKFMEFLQALPGVNIPQEVQERIRLAQDPLKEGLKICSQTIRELRAFADGVHIMAIGMEEYIPQIIADSL